MTLSIFQRTIVNASGDVQPGASVSVRDELTNNLVQIFSDRAGTVVKQNPFTADENGFATFFVSPGEYKVTATTSSGSVTWNYVAVDGTLRTDLATTGAGKGAEMVAFKQSGTGAVDRTVSDKLREFVSVEDFGASPGASAAVNTAAIHAALAAANQIYFPAGTYEVTGITIPESQKSFVGDTGSRPIIRLANGANNHVIYGNNVNNIEFHNIQVDGNKANQSIGAGNNWRGIYLLGSCQRLRFDNVIVSNGVDHGIFLSDGGTLSNECGKNSLMTNCRVHGCGSAAHISAGGAGGTGMVGGHTTTVWNGCFAYANHLNGFKSRGLHIGCKSYENGGGFETGFSAPEVTQTKYLGCWAYNNAGDGWRNQGQGDELTFIGCTAEQNAQAGISFINGVNRAIVQGCWLKNNGQDTATAYSDVEGFSGVFVGGTTLAPNDIVISGCHFLDDQTTKTQRHHVYIGQAGSGVTIAPDNSFGDVLTQKIYVAPAAAAAPVFIGAAAGLDSTVRDFTTATVTGTTSTTTIKSVTIPERSLSVHNAIRVVAKGSVTGTAGTKIVRLLVGGAGQIIASMTAGETQDWCVEADIYRINGTTVTITYRAYEVGGTTSTGVINTTLSLGAPLTIGVNCTLGNAGDSVTQQLFIVEPS